jgi:uncharacterized protein with HEPN domain
MDERIEKWLYDILIAIDEINSYFTQELKTFSNFQQNQIGIE